MDALSIIGLGLALIAIVGGQWLEGGSLSSLIQAAAFLIVIGGTLGAVLLQSPLATFLHGMRLVRWIFRPPNWGSIAAIRQITEWGDIARREGLLALQNRLSSVGDPFTRNGLQMLVDGFDPGRIREALDIEIAAFDESLRRAARIWEAAGGYAPTIGILGAVLGLIHVMENLTDPTKLGGGIAVAFVATIYGIASANLIFLPIASKLKTLIHAGVIHRELVLDGICGIANGENPKMVALRLRGYLG